VRLLAVSDHVDEVLDHDPRVVGPVDLVVSCGDLPFDYLAHLMDALEAPVAFVAGNHDPDVSGYTTARSGLVVKAGLPAEPPWPPGAANADGHVVDVAGVRIAGLGGCRRYSDGPNQYTERQQRRRGRRLVTAARWNKFRDGRRVDLVLTHAPPLGVGDGDDDVHRGFAAHLDLIDRLRPPLLLHGHVDGGAGSDRHGDTVVRNVVGRHVLELEPQPAHQRHAS
jgi:predicted phosphodiesterase